MGSALSRATAGDLTFATVRDGAGLVISDANSVDVWNTRKGSVKSYPVRGGQANRPTDLTGGAEVFEQVGPMRKYDRFVFDSDGAGEQIRIIEFLQIGG